MCERGVTYVAQMTGLVLCNVCVSGADLRCTDDRLASGIAASSHHLLGNEDFLRRNLNAQVAPGNHHPITRRQDLVEASVGRGGGGRAGWL